MIFFMLFHINSKLFLAVIPVYRYFGSGKKHLEIFFPDLMSNKNLETLRKTDSHIQYTGLIRGTLFKS